MSCPLPPRVLTEALLEEEFSKSQEITKQDISPSIYGSLTPQSGSFSPKTLGIVRSESFMRKGMMGSATPEIELRRTQCTLAARSTMLLQVVATSPTGRVRATARAQQVSVLPEVAALEIPVISIGAADRRISIDSEDGAILDGTIVIQVVQGEFS